MREMIIRYEKALHEKNKNIIDLQQQISNVKRIHRDQNTAIIQKNVSLQRSANIAMREREELRQKNNELQLEIAALKGKNDELLKLIQQFFTKQETIASKRKARYLDSNDEITPIKSHSSSKRQSEQSATPVHSTPTARSAICRQLSMEKKEEERRRSEVFHTPNQSSILSDNTPVPKREIDQRNTQVKTKCCSVQTSIDEIQTVRKLDYDEKKSENVNDKMTSNTPTSDYEQIVEKKPIKTKKEKKRVLRRHQRNVILDDDDDEIKENTPPNQNREIIPQKERSGINRDSTKEQENSAPVQRRSTRQRKIVDYKEPSLKSKLRKGYKHTFGGDETKKTRSRKLKK